MATELTIKELIEAKEGTNFNLSYGWAYQFAELVKNNNTITGTIYKLNYDTGDYDKYPVNIDLTKTQDEIWENLPCPIKVTPYPFWDTDFETVRQDAIKDRQNIIIA